MCLFYKPKLKYAYEYTNEEYTYSKMSNTKVHLAISFRTHTKHTFDLYKYLHMNIKEKSLYTNTRIHIVNRISKLVRCFTSVVYSLSAITSQSRSPDSPTCVSIGDAASGAELIPDACSGPASCPVDASFASSSLGRRRSRCDSIRCNFSFSTFRFHDNI